MLIHADEKVNQWFLGNGGGVREGRREGSPRGTRAGREGDGHPHSLDCGGGFLGAYIC